MTAMIQASIARLSASSIRALAGIMSQGNGTYMVTVHKGQIVSTAKVARPEKVAPTDEAGVEVIIRGERGA